MKYKMSFINPEGFAKECEHECETDRQAMDYFNSINKMCIIYLYKNINGSWEIL